MGTQKKWSAEEKIAIIIDGLKGMPLKEICVRYGISDNQYYRWREEALNGMKLIFENKEKKIAKEISYEAERDNLLKIIGEQKIIIEYQKKISNAFK